MLVAKFRSLIRGVLHRRRFEQEMSDEMQSHLDARAADLMDRRGLTQEEAYRQARIEFGALEKYKEQGAVTKL